MQDAEKARQQRSHLKSILNVAQRLRLRCFHRLRPCWTAILSILLEAVWETGHMHLELAPRHIVDIAAQCVLDHGECDLVPGNCRE